MNSVCQMAVVYTSRVVRKPSTSVLLLHRGARRLQRRERGVHRAGRTGELVGQRADAPLAYLPDAAEDELGADARGAERLVDAPLQPGLVGDLDASDAA